MVLIKPVDTGFFPFEYLNEEIHKLSASDGPVFLMILFGFILFPFVYRLGYKLRYKRKTFEYILFGIRMPKCIIICLVKKILDIIIGKYYLSNYVQCIFI